jgi:hypothetical protein
VNGVRALPVTLRIAVLVLFAEAAGLAALAAWGATGGDIAFPVLLAIFAVVLALLGWQLIRLRSWARGPAVTLELLLLPLGYLMAAGGAAWLGVPAMVAGLACTGLLVAPASRQALGIR